MHTMLLSRASLFRCVHARSLTFMSQSQSVDSSPITSVAKLSKHENTIYIHPTPSENTYALSFLASNSRLNLAKNVLGWVRTQTPLDTTQPKLDVDINPGNFVASADGEELLHVLLHRVVHLDQGIQALAIQQQTGHLNVPDQRIYVPYGRIPDPEDILGAVSLDHGTIVPGSYERNGTHRIVSSKGVCVVPEAVEKAWNESK